jgi:predicted dehydrogenase
MKKINLGIIGCGHWGPNFVRNFSQMPDVNLICVCDADPKKLEPIRQKYPGLATLHDASDLLKNQELDAVVISTPASTHYRLVKNALSANKHVLVEKPISIKTGEAQDLIRISKKQKKILMVGHTFLFNPAVNKAKEIIENKRLGRIYYIHCRRTNLGPLRKDVNAIWDLSLHDISILNYLLDAMPLEAAAYGQCFLSHKLEDVGFIILKYPKNILAHIHVSWLDPKKIREMVFIGDRKMLAYDDINLDEPVKVYDKGVMKARYELPYKSFKEFQLIIRNGATEVLDVEKEEPLKRECRHFIDCVNSGLKPLTGAQEGLSVLKVLSAIDKSIVRKGRFIKIE